MGSVEAATQTQLNNIQDRTGKSLGELTQLALSAGLTRHGEIRDFYKRELNLGHGDANTLAHFALQSASGATPLAEQAPDAVLDQIYGGNKAALRPLHDRVMAEIHTLGAFEISPKKTYLSLRRKKQFAMVGPATQKQMEVGLNMKGVTPTDRLVELPPGGMCNYRVRLSDSSEVNDELIAWIKLAYESAG